jgi:deoxyribodipyrimidine photo-lyase
VVFCVVFHFPGATRRQYGFMLRGLEEVERDLAAKRIPFCLLAGAPKTVLPEFLNSRSAGLLMTDFHPLKIKQAWKQDVARRISIPLHEVDAHNIVPCWIASPKQEYGAYTLRPELRRLLPAYLTEHPRLRPHPNRWPGPAAPAGWRAALRDLAPDDSVGEVRWPRPGEQAAQHALGRFISNGLDRYVEDRNDPNLRGQSNLSTCLHFGQLPAQRAAHEVMRAQVRECSREAFLEELIVRRELSDNFCNYQKDYDNPRGFPAWAQRTPARHGKDRRDYRYTRRELEGGRTHDGLWNAAQREMVMRGSMPGYLRMYWAKKILEWTRTPAEAMKIAIALNDRYDLDGRDPNGYAGIAWSIGGVHDRPWGERKVFGMVCFMSLKGCWSKFDVDGYIGQVARRGGGEGAEGNGKASATRTVRTRRGVP